MTWLTKCSRKRNREREREEQEVEQERGGGGGCHDDDEVDGARSRRRRRRGWLFLAQRSLFERSFHGASSIPIGKEEKKGRGKRGRNLNGSRCSCIERFLQEGGDGGVAVCTIQ